MFSLRIGRMYKRLNSTKSSFSTIHTATNVKLKEHTSVTSPVFLLKNTNSDGTTYYYDKADVNYLYWAGYGYYWIDDIVYITNDLIEIYCHKDALATGKPYIEKTNAYVKYCADPSKVSSRHIIDDERFGPDLYLSSSYDTLATHDIGQGESLVESMMILGDQATVVLTVVGNGTPPYSLFLSVHDYTQFMTEYLENSGTSLINTIDRLTERFMGLDWHSCILSAVFVPIKKSWFDNKYATTFEKIYVGGIEVDIGVTMHATVPLVPVTKSYLRSITFPDLVKKNGYTWLKGPKYTKLTYVYPGGSLDLSNEALTDYALLYIEETLNPFNGDHIIKFYTTDEYHDKEIFLGVARDCIALDLTSMTAAAISSETTAMNFAQNFGKAAVGVASAAIGIQSAVHNIRKGDMVKTFENVQDISTGISGAFPTGNIQPVAKNIEISTSLDTWLSSTLDGQGFDMHKYRLVTSTCIPAAFVDEPTGSQAPTSSVKYDEFADLFGWPLYQVISLDGVDGYVECVGADIGEVASTDYEDITYRLHPSEIAEINNHLNSGLYLE